jgi:dephospho-CoA kinase
MIIGLSGSFASGKDALALFLQDEYGYLHVNTSDIVRGVAMKKVGNIERPSLVIVANQLRSERGAGVLVQMGLERFAAQAESGSLVISGIRSIGEVEAIVEAGGVMVFVDAPIEVRYARIKNRARSNEQHLTLAEFAESEKLEYEKHDPSDKSVQNIAIVKSMSSVRLDNSSDLQSFYRLAEQQLNLSK